MLFTNNGKFFNLLNYGRTCPVDDMYTAIKGWNQLYHCQCGPITLYLWFTIDYKQTKWIQPSDTDWLNQLTQKGNFLSSTKYVNPYIMIRTWETCKMLQIIISEAQYCTHTKGNRLFELFGRQRSGINLNAIQWTQEHGWTSTI